MVAIHMTCSLLSYFAFLAAFIFGLLFLIQDRQLKHKHMGWLFHRLPSLGTLEHTTVVAIGVGFALLTVGLAFGVFGMKHVVGRWWTGDPKEYLTLTLWVVYLVLWVAQLRSTVRGRRVALLSIAGFGLVMFTLIGPGELFRSLHPYRYSRQPAGHVGGLGQL